MPAPVIAFDVDSGPRRVPLAQRIARSVARDVQRGRLLPGTKLPGSRQLARSLGVHRNTVLAAFEELEREGLIETRPARGTFIAGAMPRLPSRAPGAAGGRARRATPAPSPPPFSSLSSPRASPARPIPLTLASVSPVARERVGPIPDGALPMHGGLSDLRLLPRASLARAYRLALRDTAGVVDYGDPLGDPRLRAALSRMLADRRGVRAADGELIVTRGSQMGLFLAARVLARPGAVVAVEAPGYRPAWEAFRLAGMALAPIPVDRAGLDVDALDALCARQPVAAVYLTPHHQYPTTVTLSAPRRLALLRLAAARGFAIIEDDYDHEVQFVGRPVLPLASADDARVVIYCGTLSKVFAPGVRIGYVAAQPPVIEAMRRLRYYFDRQGDLAVERAMAYLIEDGELDAQIRRTRRACEERREALMHELASQLGDVLSFRAPNGGLALWTKVRRDVAVEAWARAALERGVVVQTGRWFTFDERVQPFMRLGYGRLDPGELRRGVRLLRQALPSGPGRRARLRLP